MKHISNYELNADLARIKSQEHHIIAEKVCKVASRVVTFLVISFVTFSCILFAVQTIQTLPTAVTFSDSVVLVMFGIIRNILIASVCFMILSCIAQGIKWLYHKIKG